MSGPVVDFFQVKVFGIRVQTECSKLCTGAHSLVLQHTVSRFSGIFSGAQEDRDQLQEFRRYLRVVVEQPMHLHVSRGTRARTAVIPAEGGR